MDLRKYSVIFRVVCGVSGRGIIRIAVEGPTRELGMSSVGIKHKNTVLRQRRRASDPQTEKIV
jgi:hypothetical protein